MMTVVNKSANGINNVWRQVALWMGAILIAVIFAWFGITNNGLEAVEVTVNEHETRIKTVETSMQITIENIYRRLDSIDKKLEERKG